MTEPLRTSPALALLSPPSGTDEDTTGHGSAATPNPQVRGSNPRGPPIYQRFSDECLESCGAPPPRSSRRYRSRLEPYSSTSSVRSERRCLRHRGTPFRQPPCPRQAPSLRVAEGRLVAKLISRRAIRSRRGSPRRGTTPRRPASCGSSRHAGSHEGSHRGTWVGLHGSDQVEHADDEQRESGDEQRERKRTNDEAPHNPPGTDDQAKLVGRMELRKVRRSRPRRSRSSLIDLEESPHSRGGRPARASRARAARRALKGVHRSQHAQKT